MTTTTILKHTIILCFALLITACGGGSGGSSKSFAGTWGVEQFIASENSCDREVGGSVFYTINQDGANVVVENIQTNAILTGSTDKENSILLAGDTLAVPCPSGVTGNFRTALALILSSFDDDRAEATLEFTGDCPTTTCHSVLTGTAIRN